MSASEYASCEMRIQEIESAFMLFAQRTDAMKEFRLLFSEYAGLRQRRLEAMATRITQCPHAAEDVVQEAFVALHRRLTEAQTDGNTGAWLTKVVRNIAIDHVRKAKTRQAISFDGRYTSDRPSPREAYIEAEAAARVWGCIADLPDAQRRVVELRALEGLDFVEIGGALGTSPDTARRYYYRAVVQVREQLGKDI